MYLKTMTLLALFIYLPSLIAQEHFSKDEAKAPAIQLVFSKKELGTAFSGRVFVVASKRTIADQPLKQAWFKPDPFFAMDVKDWQPEQPLHFSPTLTLPHSLDKLPKGKYYVQAIMDRDLGGIDPLTSPGNVYSKPLILDFDPQQPSKPIQLTLDRVIAERQFQEKERVKLVDIPSKLLCDFHKKPMRLRAGVVLPKSFAMDMKRHYPVVYEIPGFGGNHFAASIRESSNATDVAGEEMIWAVLDPNCRLGHHVFADSDNNGPYGRALVEELVPFIEKTYRGVGVPGARFVTGHSSGGWSSLWLQITYPGSFGGVWSTAPDPVDFRDFQLVDIYQPKTNLFTDEKGQLRPLARKGKEVTLRYKPFNDMEVVMGRGGQLFSFEAVFSPQGADGKPKPLWDHTTGWIDLTVAEAWKRYDIRLILEKNWKRLGPMLAGKIHVYMGGEDTFYLDGATRLLQKSLKDLGSDAVIEVFPGKDHGSLMTKELRQRIAREMAETYRKTRHLSTN